MNTGLLHARSFRPASRRNERSRYVPRLPEPLAPTMIFFVRHAAHALLDRVLVGRKPDVPLSAEGLEQAHHLARQLAEKNISRVVTSPRERAIQTATAIARAAGAPMAISFALDEIDAGAWTGLSFEELAKDGSWSFWNMLRSIARPPEGESMGEVQERVVRYLARLHVAHPGERIVLVSHAEVIRTAVLACQGRSLDSYAEVQIAPAGVIELAINDQGAQLTIDGEAG